MSKKVLAITTCRVSTPEQEENNSLKRQADAVKIAANELGAIIPADGQWSGNVSSKVGKNVDRKDLKQMLEYCKKQPAVKYLIVHEVDRFMRSIQELFYFEVEFEKVGVKVWYASQPDLNTNDHKAKLFKALEAFKGEASNDERITKSIAGQTDALKEGRYPFAPKPGYKHGYHKGIPEPHDIKAPALKEVLLDILDGRLDPTDALKKLNSSSFMNGRKSLYKMDKFRKIVTDPFYAGVVEIHKQVKYRNENGRHDPLITLEQHYKLLRIMDNKKKYQTGPRKNGNPDYPLSNLVTCKLCVESSKIPRYVGFKHGNGKNVELIYHKYRCRSCRRYITRDEMHLQVTQQFKKHPITKIGTNDLIKALDTVWKQREAQSQQDAFRLSKKIEDTRATINSQAIAAIDPTNISIKQEILSSISTKKDQMVELEEELSNLNNESDNDREQFLRFALDFANNMGSRFLQLSKDNRLKCKQIIFPAGFYLDENNKVYTPEISPLYRLATNKKDTEVSKNVNMVRVQGL